MTYGWFLLLLAAPFILWGLVALVRRYRALLALDRGLESAQREAVYGEPPPQRGCCSPRPLPAISAGRSHCAPCASRAAVASPQPVVVDRGPNLIDYLLVDSMLHDHHRDRVVEHERVIERETVVHDAGPAPSYEQPSSPSFDATPAPSYDAPTTSYDPPSFDSGSSFDSGGGSFDSGGSSGGGSFDT